jgi:hypothetical protein
MCLFQSPFLLHLNSQLAHIYWFDVIDVIDVAILYILVNKKLLNPFKFNILIKSYGHNYFSPFYKRDHNGHKPKKRVFFIQK